MKDRSEILDEFKWDMGLFKSKDEIEHAFKCLEELTNEVKNYYGKFNDKEVFFDYYSKKNVDRMIEFEKLCFYASNTLNTDNSNIEMLKLIDRIDNAVNKFNIASAFVSSQLNELDEEYLKELLNDTRSKDLNNIINDIIKSKPHELDEKSNLLLSKIQNSGNNSSSIFSVISNSELPFKDAVNKDGKKYPMNNADYANYIISHDRTLRKSAFESMMGAYKQFNKTFAELYLSNAKSLKDYTELYNYPSLLDWNLSGEDVPKEVYNNNITCINKNLNTLQNIVKLFNNKSGLTDYSYFDLFENIENDTKFDLKSAKDIILNALSPLGNEYISLVKKKLSDKSIDYMPNKNKRSGAYSSSQYGAKTLILMNWQDDFESVSTLIHEMGHCINSEYYNMTQPSQKADITIFAAEIASTVNELLLIEHMLKLGKNKEFYLKEFLNMVRSTIFRQTLFSEFEYFVHTSIQNEENLTYEELNNKYGELNKVYYGDSCILPEDLKYEWSRIPHFYSAYYVYSYSTGLITAINIVDKLLKDKNYVNNYIEFLKNGTDKKAVDILKEIGIDLTTFEPFDIAFNYINSKIEEFKKIK